MDILPNNNRDGFSPLGLLLLLLLFILLGSAIGGMLSLALGWYMDMDLQVVLENFNQNSPKQERTFIRLVNLFNQLFTFTVPAIVLGVLLAKRSWLTFLQLHRAPKPPIFGVGILFIFSVFIVSLASYWLNQQLPLPEWADSMEGRAAEMTQGLLVMDDIGELLLTLVVVAVLPALGEELIFRGIVQRQLQEHIGNPHTAIWIAALIFSLFHLQFAGALPRLVLGAGLGYLFWWTNSLWVPIVAHFVINGMQIAGQYIWKSALAESSAPEVNWGATAIATVMVAGLSYYLQQHHTSAVDNTQNPEI
jgi:membrane protease YdiL (CAAX protease family)